MYIMEIIHDYIKDLVIQFCYLVICSFCVQIWRCVYIYINLHLNSILGGLYVYVTLSHSDQRKLEGYIFHIPSQPGHYNDIALCTGHYNDIAREGNPLIYPSIRRLNYYKTSILYIVDLISFTSGIEYFTFQQSF